MAAMATFVPPALPITAFNSRFRAYQAKPFSSSPTLVPSPPMPTNRLLKCPTDKKFLHTLSTAFRSPPRNVSLASARWRLPRRSFTVHCSDKPAPASAPAPDTWSGLQSLGTEGRFKNRFLDLARLGSLVNNAAESFFKSEIRRRLFVTAVLILVSRVGYFVPLPGFDRRLIPEDYLSFASRSMDELGDFSAELKLSLFQLGISPQIAASILMQVLCHIVPSLVKLRKEGLDGNEKIKSYIWWTSLGFAMLEAVIVACYSLQYSVYAASHRLEHVLLTSSLLVLGAMSMTWICDTITESGFGQGSSLVICVGILTGYTDTLYKMLSHISGNAVSWWPYIPGVLGIFTVVTMWAVLVTEGCRKIKLQYYAFKLASASRNGGSPVTEVEPYIPFNINPSGMQPVLTASYLLAFPSIMASLFASPFLENIKEILNPQNSVGAGPWVYYSVYALFVFIFNIFDIEDYYCVYWRPPLLCLIVICDRLTTDFQWGLRQS